jgi:tryptophan-rich sensory protein
VHWAIAAAICVAAAAFEGVMAGARPFDVLRNLRQPTWSPSFSVWVVIGLVWYAICYVALVRFLDGPGIASAPAMLLVGLMAANGAWNFILFRARRFDAAFIYVLAYGILLGTFLWTAWSDRIVVLLFAAYAIYLPYAAAWIWRLWLLNGSRA